MPKLHSRLTETILRQCYIDQGLSTYEIAGRLATNRESVRKLIYQYKIPMRSTGEGRRKWYARRQQAASERTALLRTGIEARRIPLKR